MSVHRATVPRPLPPRDECLQDGRHVLRAKFEGSDVLCCYDSARQSAATFYVDAGVWKIHVPIPLHEYLQALALNGFDLPGGPDFQTWITAVTGKEFAAWLDETYSVGRAN